ncbi:sensor histidine kinase [Rugamonas apoptosis]|uniref:histidine kinase n=1 Tax=Rugamonas apoptosis TaxID=2758570 RepID=A0A7W2IMS3_9BURK|nr:sensor histidine kinase [Rugamonas apoptosis]MBA5689988.1 sensor histidine kinase [Rugamonas apoptosis]
MRSLKSRLAVWILLPTIAISAADLFFSYHRAEQIAALVQQQLLIGSAKIISEQLSSVDGGYEINVPPAAFELFANKYHDRIFLSVHTKSGLLIAGDGELPAYSRPLQVEQETFFQSTLRGEPVRVIAYKHALPSTTSSDYAVTQIAQTMHGHDAFRDDLLRLTVREHLTLLSILIVGLLIALRWTLKPLIEFGQQLRQRQPGSLERLDVHQAPAELTPIIVAMNDYASRLDRTLGAYEQFVANTAHHLRTTFAILTSQINFGRRSPGLDSTQQEVLDALNKAVIHGNKVINQLLVLATVEQAGREKNTANEVALAPILLQVMEELAPLAQQKHIELGVDTLDEEATVCAQTFLLREVVTNLLDNAIQHIPPDGSITVSLNRVGTTAVMCVDDNGPGIPIAEREKVFERFYRLDRSRVNSSGLGLAIVREICHALHADVTLSTTENNAGLRVQVTFPLAQAEVAPEKIETLNIAHADDAT